MTTTLQRVQRAHVALMRSDEFCALSGILMTGNVTIDPKYQTAKTDGYNVWYGENFIDNLDDKLIRFVVVHEAMHKALRQLTIWRRLYKQDPRRANMASDYVINLQIKDMDPTGKVVTVWENCLIDEKYRGMDTQQVFNLLEQQQPGKPGKPGKPSDGEGQPGEPGEPMDEHDWEGQDTISEEEQAARDAEIDQAMRQGMEIARKRGGTGARTLEKLLEPQVDWRTVLHDFVNSVTSGKDSSTWRRPNRRWLGQGLYMPSAISETMGVMVVGIDASGSISQHEITTFASELVAVCEAVSPERVYVVWWHHEVANVQTFERGDYETMPDKLKPKGTGGTTPQCLFDWIEHANVDAECVLVLTDGEVFGAWPVPVSTPTLWAITGQNVAPWGQTVKLKA